MFWCWFRSDEVAFSKGLFSWNIEEDHYYRLRHQEKMREMQFSMRRRSAEPRRKKYVDQPVSCVLMCLLKSLVVKKEAWQCSHRNRRTPSCLCKCTFKWNFCLKKKIHTLKILIHIVGKSLKIYIYISNPLILSSCLSLMHGQTSEPRRLRIGM